MGAVNKKNVWVIAVVFLLAAVAVTFILPDRGPAVSDADLVFVHSSDFSVGSVYISYTNAAGSNVTEGGMTADNSLLKRGDDLQFEGVAWPVTVTVCSDLQGCEVLAQVIVEEDPAEGWYWQVALVDSAAGARLMVMDVQKK